MEDIDFDLEKASLVLIDININAEQIYKSFMDAKKEMENVKDYCKGNRANLIIGIWNENVNDVVKWLNYIMTTLPEEIANFIEEYAKADNSSITVDSTENISITDLYVETKIEENLFFSSSKYNEYNGKMRTAFTDCINCINSIVTSVKKIKWNDLVGNSYRHIVYGKCNNAIEAIDTLIDNIENGIFQMKSDLEQAEKKNINLINIYDIF